MKTGEAPDVEQQPLEQLINEGDVRLAFVRADAKQPLARAEPAIETVQRFPRALPRRGRADDHRHFDAAFAAQGKRDVEERRVSLFLVGDVMSLEQPARQLHHWADARRDDHVTRRIEILDPGGLNVGTHDGSRARASSYSDRRVPLSELLVVGQRPTPSANL